MVGKSQPARSTMHVNAPDTLLKFTDAPSATTETIFFTSTSDGNYDSNTYSMALKVPFAEAPSKYFMLTLQQECHWHITTKRLSQKFQKH